MAGTMPELADKLPEECFLAGTLAASGQSGRKVSRKTSFSGKVWPMSTACEVMMPEEWLSIADAVKRFGIPERTLRGHLERGKLKGERRGRSWFICVSEPVISNNPSNINKLPPPR